MSSSRDADFHLRPEFMNKIFNLLVSHKCLDEYTTIVNDYCNGPKDFKSRQKTIDSISEILKKKGGFMRELYALLPSLEQAEIKDELQHGEKRPGGSDIGFWYLSHYCLGFSTSTTLSMKYGLENFRNYSPYVRESMLFGCGRIKNPETDLISFVLGVKRKSDESSDFTSLNSGENKKRPCKGNDSSTADPLNYSHSKKTFNADNIIEAYPSNYYSVQKVPASANQTTLAGCSILKSLLSVTQTAEAGPSHFYPLQEVPANVSQTAEAGSSSYYPIGNVSDNGKQTLVRGSSNNSSVAGISIQIKQTSNVGASNDYLLGEDTGDENRIPLPGPSHFSHQGVPGDVNNFIVTDSINKSVQFTKMTLELTNEVEKRFGGHPDTITHFYEIQKVLNKHFSQNKPVKYVSECIIMKQIAKLFKGHDDLISQFNVIIRSTGNVTNDDA